MELTLNNDEKSLKVDSKDVTLIIQTVNKLVGEDLVFSHLVIDDQTIYSDHELYIQRYINDIKNIKVIAKTKKDYINEIFLTAEGYLENSYSSINNLIDQFYKGPTNDSWNTFKDMSEGIHWLNDMILMVDRMEDRPNNWKNYVQVYHQLEGAVKELADAVENQDVILIADILDYEMKPLFSELKHLITITIDQEGRRPNAN
jgi:hypothetical protein